MAKQPKQPLHQDPETTGHTWDGIEEFNNPLPRWWLWTFYATIFWAVLYTIAYPAWPLVSGATTGILGYSTRAEVAKDIQTFADANAADRGKTRGCRPDHRFRRSGAAKLRAQRRCCGLQDQLFAVPRFWCGGRQGLSEPVG